MPEYDEGRVHFGPRVLSLSPRCDDIDPLRKIPQLTLDYTRNTNFAETPPVNRATSIPHAFSTTNEQKLMPMLMSPIGDLICYSDLID